VKIWNKESLTKL